MDYIKQEQFYSANQELRDFLKRVDGLTAGTCSITEDDLQALSQRLSTLAPEVSDASRSETLGVDSRDEMAQYVTNLRALQIALEKVRCVMLTRKMQLETQRRHLDRLQGWVNAYHQTM